MSHNRNIVVTANNDIYLNGNKVGSTTYKADAIDIAKSLGVVTNEPVHVQSSYNTTKHNKGQFR